MYTSDSSERFVRDNDGQRIKHVGPQCDADEDLQAVCGIISEICETFEIRGLAILAILARSASTSYVLQSRIVLPMMEAVKDECREIPTSL